MIASAPCPSLAAAATMSSTRKVPSTTENSVWLRRWMKSMRGILGKRLPGMRDGRARSTCRRREGRAGRPRRLIARRGRPASALAGTNRGMPPVCRPPMAQRGRRGPVGATGSRRAAQCRVGARTRGKPARRRCSECKRPKGVERVRRRDPGAKQRRAAGASRPTRRSPPRGRAAPARLTIASQAQACRTFSTSERNSAPVEDEDDAHGGDREASGEKNQPIAAKAK